MDSKSKYLEYMKLIIIYTMMFDNHIITVFFFI